MNLELIEELFDSRPEEIEPEVYEQLLRESLSALTDHLGHYFQDRPWWGEALALARALRAEERR